MQLHPLFLVCGPTAAGKTAVVEAAIERLAGRLTIIPTTTTRLPRDSELEQGTAWYTFTSREAAQAIIQAGQAVNFAEFAGNLYISSRQQVDDVLQKTCGVQIVVEPSVNTFRQAGYEVIAINLLPSDAPFNPRAQARAAEDAARQGSIVYDYTIINQFSADGPAGPQFAATVERFCERIRQLS